MAAERRSTSVSVSSAVTVSFFLLPSDFPITCMSKRNFETPEHDHPNAELNGIEALDFG